MAQGVLLVTGLLSCLLGAGCVSATAGIATSNVPLEGRQYDVIGTAEAHHNWLAIDLGIIGFPLEAPPVDAAVADLLKQKQGDALINLRYSTDKIVVLFVLNIYRFHLKADVVKLKPEVVIDPKTRR